MWIFTGVLMMLVVCYFVGRRHGYAEGVREGKGEVLSELVWYKWEDGQVWARPQGELKEDMRYD